MVFVDVRGLFVFKLDGGKCLAFWWMWWVMDVSIQGHPRSLSVFSFPGAASISQSAVIGLLVGTRNNLNNSDHWNTSPITHDLTGTLHTL